MRDIYLVEDGKLIEYQRQGSCNGCGACCRDFRITYSAQIQLGTENTEEEDAATHKETWGPWEGYSVFWSQNVWWWIKITDITEENKGCGEFLVDGCRCKVWQDPEDWPILCRYWPIHPSNLEKFPQCGFNFERIGEVDEAGHHLPHRAAT